MNPAHDHELRLVLSPSDWSNYHRIRRTVLFEARGRVGIYDENRPEEHRDEHPSLLLFYKDAPVGTARLDCDTEGIGIVSLVAIDQRAQGAGHGRILISLVEDRVRTFGIKVLEVNSAPDAVVFYQRVGFKLIDGEREFPILRRKLGQE